MLVVEVDRLVVGGGALHRQMQAQFRVGSRCVTHQAGVGQDDGIDAEFHGVVHRALPALPLVGLREGVERKQHLGALGVCVAHAFEGAGLVEIQAGEGTRIGVVLKAHVDAIGAVVDGDFQGGQIARRTDQFKRHDEVP